MKQFKLQASNEQDEHLGEIIVDITEDESFVLSEYLENYNKLLKCKILESPFPMIEEFSFKNGSLSIKVTEFEYRDLYELLHLSRPLFLKKEPASFEKVCNIFGKKFARTVFAKHIKDVRLLFRHGEHRQFMQFSINGINLFDEKIIDQWLNGMEYHHDPEKKQFIKELESTLGEEVAVGVFVSILKGRLRALGHIAHLAKTCTS
ncbi:hypothetical protein J7384_00480 [Endozoicomonas sp. G2_1]|uniref:hypothetical protein n=1 Tax=Endozoicomonas sp. G2_1 TaxID=2821091 RepID=UPI001AD9C7E7|nr:hypothetical protein [Endozoicomonas sp. G2_1]MBO9488830.1 hypothetical protein [Endozoicomonas sp. G2_1]